MSLVKSLPSVPTTIIFDLDDTLYSKAEVFSQTFAQYATCDLSKEDLYDCYATFSDEAFRLHEDGQITLAESRVYRLKKLFEALHQPQTNDIYHEFAQKYIDKMSHLELSPDWQEVLHILHNKGYTLGILTNGPSHHQRNKLESLHIAPLIPKENWFISGELDLQKPDPAIFEKVAQRLQVSAKDCLMIGDSYQNDMLGAKNSHWQGIMYWEHAKTPTTDEGTFLTVHSPQELLNYL